MKKAKIQDIADLLKVSRVTVWKVLNNKEGVSEEMRQRVLQCAAQLEDQLSGNANMVKSKTIPMQKLVSVVVSRPESSSFWIKTIHELAEEFSRKGIGLMYTYLPSNIEESYVLPPSLTSGNLHGIIIMNVYEAKMIRLLNELTVPKVFLDVVPEMPFEELNGDLLLLEGQKSVSKIVEEMIKSGRKRIGFIGDIYYAKTNMDRYEGYLLALKKNGLPVDEQICYTGSMSLDMYATIIENFVLNLPVMPDAFVCVNDHAATMLLQCLTSNGYRVPEDVAVSGYDDNNEFTFTKELTTVQVDNKLLGKRLARQMLYRMENPDYAYEVTYILPKVIFRKSTGDIED